MSNQRSNVTGSITQSMNRVGCTIISANYLHFGLTVAESFLKVHPDGSFYILLVDRLQKFPDTLKGEITFLSVEELNIPKFNSIAFKYDILELNTCVKPSFLKYLLKIGAQALIYFDPDIYIFQPLEVVYSALKHSSIVLTPHILSSTPDEGHTYENDFLITGVFNLGFIGLANTDQSLSFLNWWEERCLEFGFHDLRSGLFVDQKWIDLAPCLFNKVHILRDPGCNVAYWNLHERKIGRTAEGTWSINDGDLVFFHYSGYEAQRPTVLSKKMRVHVDVYEELQQLLLFYKDQLDSNEAEKYSAYRYTYASFSDGSQITALARRLYSATKDHWKDDPFDADGDFYRALRRKNLLSREDESGRYNSGNLPSGDRRLHLLNKLIFSLPRIVGGNRYTMLMKYLSYISILRNQRQLLLQNKS